MRRSRTKLSGVFAGATVTLVALGALTSPSALAGVATYPLPTVADSHASTTQLRGSITSGTGRRARPLAGLNVTVFEAGPLASEPIGHGRSNARGRFSIAIPSGVGVTYVVAQGDRRRELVTLRGSSASSVVTINEMTTVAAAYATSQITEGNRIAGSPLQLSTAADMAANLVSPATGRPSKVIRTSPNANETNTWHELGTLSNILAPCVRRDTKAACRDLVALTRTKQSPTTWNAARAIALNPARKVKRLFDLGSIVHAFRPYLSKKQGPSSRDKWLRLDAFTLAVKFNGTGRTQDGAEVCPFGGPGNITFDLQGYGWITNNVVQGTPDSAHCIVVLRPDGHPSDGVGGTPDSPLVGGGIVGQGFGIGFDPSGRLWSGNFGWGSSQSYPTSDGTTPGGSVSLFSGSGEAISGPYGYQSNLYRVQGTVSDADGNIWMASYGNSRVQIFPAGDPSSDFPYYADDNSDPFDLRLDADGDAWVSYTQSSTVSKLRFTPSGVQKLFTVAIGSSSNPKGVSVDSDGNAWVAAGAEDKIYAFSSSGQPLGSFSGGGIVGPWGVSTDSSDSVWVANFGGVTQVDLKYGVSRLCGAVAGKCPHGLALGDPMTPSTGYTLPSGGDPVLLHSGEPLYGAGSQIKSFKPLMRETAVQPDSVGNLWVTNNWKPSGAIDTAGGNPGGDGLVIFVGIASPVAPKLFSGPPTTP